MSRSSAAVKDIDDPNARLAAAEQTLEELLTVFDEMEGCTIVALHVYQAINALRDIDRATD